MYSSCWTENKTKQKKLNLNLWKSLCGQSIYIKTGPYIALSVEPYAYRGKRCFNKRLCFWAIGMDRE